MSSKKNRLLKISSIKIEGIDHNIYTNISTHFFNNSELVGISNNKNTDSHVEIPLINNAPTHIQLVLRKYEDLSTNYGSISFNYETFRDIPNGHYEQWFTIFDEPDDDLFDGIIGHDDEERPRVLIRFELENMNKGIENDYVDESFGILKDSTHKQNIANQLKIIRFKDNNNNNNSNGNGYLPLHHRKDSFNKESYKENTSPSQLFISSSSSSCLTLKNFAKSKNGYFNAKITKKEDIVNDENIIHHTNFNESPNVIKRNMYKTQFNTPRQQYASFSEANSKLCSGHRDFTDNEREEEFGVVHMLQDISMEKTGNTGILKSETSMCTTREEFDTLKAFKKNYENEVELLNAKLLEANELAKNAKCLREAISTKDQDVDIHYSYHQRLQQYENACKMLNDENLRLKERITELEVKVDDIESTKENIKTQKDHNNQAKALEDAQQEIERQKIVIENLENALIDVKNDYENLKNMQSIHSNRKSLTDERTSESTDRIKKIMADNTKLQEDLYEEKSKHENEILSLQNQIEENQKKLENEKIKLMTELSLTKENCMSLTQQLTTQNEVVNNLKEEIQMIKEVNQAEIMHLCRELNENKNEKDGLEKQNMNLQNKLNTLVEENDRLRDMCLQNQFARAQEIIKDQDKQIKSIPSNLKNSYTTLSNQLDSNTKTLTNQRSEDSEKNGSTTTPRSDRCDHGHIIKILQNELLAKNKTIDELLYINNDLKYRYNTLNEKILINDTVLNQIEELKRQIKILENERDSMKYELTRANENYMKLTNKYVDLTDILAAYKVQKKTINPCSSSTSSNTTISNSNIIGSSKTSNTSHNFFTTISTHHDSQDDYNVIDEIDLKLQEYLQQQKLSYNIFIKLEKGIYLYNSKKILIKLSNGKLHVKTISTTTTTGGGMNTSAHNYISINDFLKNNKIINNECKMNNINRSISPNKYEIDLDERMICLDSSSELLVNKDLTATFSNPNYRTQHHTPNKDNSNRYYTKEYTDRTEKEEQIQKNPILQGGNSKPLIEKDTKPTHKKKDNLNSKSIDKKPSNMNSNGANNNNNNNNTHYQTPSLLNASSIVNTYQLRAKNYRDVSPILSKKNNY